MSSNLLGIWLGINERGPICDRWRSFDSFHEDMAPRPPGHHLHRIARRGDYEPGNCYWISPSDHRRLHMIDKAQRAMDRAQALINAQPPPTKPAPPVVLPGYEHLSPKPG